MMTYSEMEREINEIPKFGAKASLSNLSDLSGISESPGKESPGDSCCRDKWKRFGQRIY